MKNAIRTWVLVCVLGVILSTTAVGVTQKKLPECPTCRSFYSEALGVMKGYRLFLPPGYAQEKDRRYPVIVLLHGYNFARNDPNRDLTGQEEESHWMVQEQLGPIATCLMSVKDYTGLRKCLADNGVGEPDELAANMEKEYPNAKLPLPPMIVVMPDGDSSFYVNRRDGLKQAPPLNGPEFVDGVRAGATGMYEDYIVKDLIAHVDKTYRTIADRNARGIGGFSMGGIGAMIGLLRHPDVFSAGAAQSSLFTLADMINDPFTMEFMKKGSPEATDVFMKPSETGKKKVIDKEYIKSYDPIQMIRKLSRKDVRIYFDAGSGDFFSGRKGFETFTKFEKALGEEGIKSSPSVHIIQANEHNGNGLHTARYWRSRLGVLLEFFADSFAGNKVPAGK